MANETLVREFVYDRWSGLYPRQIMGSRSLGPHIVCHEDIYPELWIVERGAEIQRTGEVLDYTIYTNPNWAQTLAGAPNPLFTHPLQDNQAQWQAAADAMAVLEPAMHDAARELAMWDDNVYQPLRAPGVLAPPLRQPPNGTLDAAKALRELSVVDMVEGRALNYLSETFLKDASEMHSLPVAKEIYEVPTTAINIVEGARDNLGFKKITVDEAPTFQIPVSDPINPQNSDVQVGTRFSYEDTADKFHFNTGYLEAKPPSNEIHTIMALYDKFRKGDAEPEQVEQMLHGFHSLCSRPHRAMTWQEEYTHAQGQITTLCKMNEDKDKVIKRLREEKESVEEECRKLKRTNNLLWSGGPEMVGSQSSGEEPELLHAIRDSPTDSERMFSRTPSPLYRHRDPRSRSPPPM